MIIYWIACILSIIITWFGRKIKIRIKFVYSEKSSAELAAESLAEEKEKTAGWGKALVCSLPLMLIASVRYMIGTDYIAYQTIYRSFMNKWFNHDYEWLFTLLNVLLNRLGLDFQSLVVITSVIFSLLIFKAILDESPIPELSIFLLLSMTFYFQSMNIMRHMLACAICLYSVRFIEKRDPIRFGICIVLALGFHLSAFVFIPMYFLPRKKIKFKTCAIIFAAAAFFSLVAIKIFLKYIIRFGSMINNGYYETYLNQLGSGGFGIVSFAINFFLFAWAYIFSDKKDRMTMLLLNIQFTALLLSMMNGTFPLVNRLRFYYGLPGILLIPRVICSKKMKKYGSGFTVVNVTAVCVLFFGYCCFIEGVLNESGCIPYSSVF